MRGGGERLEEGTVGEGEGREGGVEPKGRAAWRRRVGWERRSSFNALPQISLSVAS